MANIAILGAGYIGRIMARTLSMMKENGEDIRLYAVGARDLARAQAFADETGFEHACGSYEELVSDPAIDLVYVATPHSHHAEHMRLCIEAGRPVLCEKAFTANTRQAREILSLAEERNVFV